MQQHRRQGRPQPGGRAGGFIAAERAHQQGTGSQVEQDGDENDCHRCSFAYPCGGGDGPVVAARANSRTRYTVGLIVPAFRQVAPHVRVLTQRLSGTIERLRGRGRLTEENIREATREVRIALLEADVALPVVQALIERIKVRAVGQEVLKSLTPARP